MKQRKILIIMGLTVLAMAMIVIGLFRVVRVYQRYKEDIISYESGHLDSIVSTTARSVDWMMRDYASQIEQLLYRRTVSQAEEDYIQSGDPEAMRLLLSNPSILQPGMSACIAVYNGDGDLLAQTDDGFPQPVSEDEELGDEMYIREDTAGEFWFVFTQTSENGLYYELAVPVQSIFSYQANTANVGQYGYLFLIDSESRFISFSSEQESATMSIQALIESDPDIDESALEELAVRRSSSPSDYIVFRYPWNTSFFNGNLSTETLVLTSALNTSSGGIVFGAAVSFQEFNSFLSDTLREVTGIIFLEIGGALVLLLMATWALESNRRGALELQVVREKADLMEEINRQQQDLAHTERLQQLGVMTTGIVHEFNNMLTPIMGQSLLLLEQLADQESSPLFEYALDIYEASENARDILLRMSAMGKKDVDMRFKPLDLGALLQKTVNLASMAKDTHIRQELVLPPEPLCVSGNDQLLTQAFLNLMINACQAMGSDGTLTVELTEEIRSGHSYARVDVRDTGPGIPEEKLRSIYDPFFTTKGERGTGLGLAICQKIIETHKGTIVAANNPGGGAVFTVCIPVCVLSEGE